MIRPDIYGLNESNRVDMLVMFIIARTASIMLAVFFDVPSAYFGTKYDAMSIGIDDVKP